MPLQRFVDMSFPDDDPLDDEYNPDKVSGRGQTVSAVLVAILLSTQTDGDVDSRQASVAHCVMQIVCNFIPSAPPPPCAVGKTMSHLSLTQT